MDPTRCKEKVLPKGYTWPRPQQCSRKAIRDGYCKQHHPDAVTARRVARETSYAAKLARSPLRVARERIAELEATVAGLEATIQQHREAVAEIMVGECTVGEIMEAVGMEIVEKGGTHGKG